MASIAGKRIVIIGGSSGIGEAVAAAVLAERGEVFIGSSQGSKIDAVKLRLGGAVDGQEVDVTREASVEGFFRHVGEFDHLVYTAGDWAHRNPRKITEVQAEDFSRALAVRFDGALLSVKHAISRMREGGSVSLTDGIVAHMPRKGAPLATAMAGAIEHLVYGLAVDIAPIRVNAVCPGAIATAVWGEDAAEQFRSFTDPLPLPRMGTPEEVAEAYMYLMKCGYTTGQVVRVDGGRSLV